MNENTPKFIKVVITEEDRQNANEYCENNSCLIATAFRRAGYDVLSVTPKICRINDWDTIYAFDACCATPEAVNWKHGSRSKPFYHSSVVGKVVACTLREAISATRVVEKTSSASLVNS